MACAITRMLDYNYFFVDDVDLTISSVNSLFPVSNLERFFRSKICRSNQYGNFVISTTNNKIDFREVNAGPQLTATLVSGTYTATTLAAQIKTQMEAVSVDTFTITYSTTTGKWTIGTSGAFLSLLNGTGTNAANSALGSCGFDALDHTGSISYLGASIAIHTEEWVSLDLQTIEDIDTFAMIFDPSFGVKLSNMAVVTVQGNATNTWASPAVSVTVAIDDNNDSATYFWDTTQSYRYWRVKIVDPKNTNLYIEWPKMWLGHSLDISRNASAGISLGYEDTSKVSQTDYGHIYADVFPIKKTLDFDLRYLDNAQTEEIFKSFIRVGKVSPVFVSIDSFEAVYDKDRLSIYGRYQSKMSGRHIVRDLMDFPLSIEESF